MEIHSDRRWGFAVDPPTLWEALSDVGSYRTWWPWLAGLDAADFAVGEQWSCAVQPPLPYTLRFTLRLDAIDPPHRAEATIAGDIAGTAQLTISAVDAGSELRLQSALAPMSPFLRSIARVARPVVRFGHDWVLDTGAGQFRRRALG